MFEVSTPYTESASKAYDAIRALNHETIFGPIPGPHLYGVLGNIKHAGGHGLAQLLEQLARGLERSLVEMDVYEDDGADPRGRVAAAVRKLNMAAERAQEIGALLEEAQVDVSQQGYRREDGEGGPHDPLQLEDLDD